MLLIVLDGMLFPDRANLYIMGIEDGHFKEKKINWWKNVYNFNMSIMSKLAKNVPLVDCVKPEQVKLKILFI